MPIYEYQCQACGHELEKLQKISDDPLKECPACGQSELQKKISAAGFRLSGAGWYETDFKSGSKKNLAGETDSGAKKEGAGDKPASKSDTKKSESKASAGTSTAAGNN